jgi:hypothetical protein
MLTNHKLVKEEKRKLSIKTKAAFFLLLLLGTIRMSSIQKNKFLIEIYKFIIDGEKNYHRDDVPESEWEFFEETSLKFLSDNFQGVNFYPEITSSNLND